MYLSRPLREQVVVLSKTYRQIGDIEGTVVECGVWKGATLSYLALLANREGKHRQVWGFDAFTPFTVPLLAAEPPPPIAPTLEYVHGRLDHAGWKNVELVPGLFCDTLPLAPPAPIAFLHLDCDVYSSYMDCLTNLWPRLSIGAVTVLDEYASAKFFGAKRAVDDFLASLHPESYALVPDTRWYIVKQTQTIGEFDGT